MKTTTSKPTNHRTQARSTSTPPALEISPYTVTTEWVKVTIPISKNNSEFLDSQNQSVRDGIGAEVSLFEGRTRRAIEFGEEVEGYKHITAKAGRLPNEETRPWSFSLKLCQWEAVRQLAPILSHTPEQIARAAIVRRISEIREFLAEQAKKGGAA